MNRFHFATRRRRLTTVAALLSLAGLGVAVSSYASSFSTTKTPKSASHAIKHVWLIVLENKGYPATFGPASPAPYLAKTLTKRGVLLANYYGTGHASLDNYVAMVSGQGANPVTQGDCPARLPVLPGVIGTDGQALGLGCVYPTAVKTIADQLDAKSISWRGYMEDIGKDPKREEATCGVPVTNALGADQSQTATAKDAYAARHNPFVFFQSVISAPSCKANVGGLDRLTTDLKSTTTTPAFSFITPNLCSDGHDAPCADGRPGGLASIDSFLKTWVPRITGSPAYRDGGLLVINFDEADTADATSCCGQPTGPDSPRAGITGPGGGRTGAVLLSPYLPGGVTDETPYNHYSLLSSLEKMFGLSKLGYAAQAGLATFPHGW